MTITKIIHLLLLYVSTIVAIVDAQHPAEVHLHVPEIKVTVKPTRSFLANENLPVWIVEGDAPNVLKREENIMEAIGPFQMYQDTDSCSAAVFFENDQYLDGTLDTNLAVKKFHYDPTKEQSLSLGINTFLSNKWTHPEAGIHTTEELASDGVKITTGKNWKYVASHIEDPETVYIETLVIVNYDIFEKLTIQEIVSDILVTMNNVDMLYSRINEPKIKINIAGIIIGKERRSFPSLIERKCYRKVEGEKSKVLIANCVNSEMKMILDNYRTTIPLNSYDIAVFLTNSKLYLIHKNGGEKIELISLGGLANSPSHDQYIGYKLSSDDIRIITAQHHNRFEHFPTIAHEIAHLFNVEHDPGRFRTDGKCSGNLMRLHQGKSCKRCLFFGDLAREQMRKFFSSRDGCIFRNKPRSLNGVSSPQLFWNIHKACQCYGFLMAQKKQQIDCEYQERLICLKDKNKVYKTGLFMDGTPCRNSRGSDFQVCWNGQCERLN